ncbi:Myosin-1 [Frankliniella fusca]|uniref:Myosin-1 n=1 Tax=Frankliniella fusca TaxID=407009 RepID=A0AAE1LSA8_9NEOP|nr:Myosin-1 [Frankliniella fusca]
MKLYLQRHGSLDNFLHLKDTFATAVTKSSGVKNLKIDNKTDMICTGSALCSSPVRLGWVQLSPVGYLFSSALSPQQAQAVERAMDSFRCRHCRSKTCLCNAAMGSSDQDREAAGDSDSHDVHCGDSRGLEHNVHPTVFEKPRPSAPLPSPGGPRDASPPGVADQQQGQASSAASTPQPQPQPQPLSPGAAAVAPPPPGPGPGRDR